MKKAVSSKFGTHDVKLVAYDDGDNIYGVCTLEQFAKEMVRQIKT